MKDIRLEIMEIIMSEIVKKEVWTRAQICRTIDKIMLEMLLKEKQQA